MGLDTYFRGDSQELAFAREVRAGGNHVVAATAAGVRLGVDQNLRLREWELAGVLEEYRALPDEKRRPTLPPAEEATPPDRPVPDPPANGLILKCYCTYVRPADDGQIVRSQEFYYKENPDRWAAETQSDMLWLTEAEWRSLVPENPEVGQRIEVADEIQRRFFSTVGIDYMEGSVNSLPPRETSISLVVEKITPQTVTLRLVGEGAMGKSYADHSRTESRSRGCRVRVLGFAEYDRQADRFTRFDSVGVGRAWGNKMSYTSRAIRIAEYPWMYGVACELVSGESPIDRIPPYNLLHYGGAGRYFPK